LTEDFQVEIPLTNWMYPVNPRTPLPDSYGFAPKPATTLVLKAQEILRNQERWINEWVKLISR